MLKVKFSLLKSNQTLLIILPPRSFSSPLPLAPPPSPIFLVPLAPSGILRDPLGFCFKKITFVSNKKMTRIENVLEQADVILFHTCFAWKQLFKSLNV